jgi:mannose-6-phosphate isomerase-like protein (cupin superfamily)
MTGSISTANAPHYVWGDACDGWHLVRSEGLSVIQELMPPGATEVRHRHARTRQFFYVLAGVLTLEVEGTFHVLTTGHGVEIAPGVPHQAINRGTEPVAFLVISQPPSHGDREAADPPSASHP